MQLRRILIYSFNHIKSHHPPYKVANPTTVTLIFFPHAYIQSHKVTSSTLQSCKPNHNEPYIFPHIYMANSATFSNTLTCTLKVPITKNTSSIFGCKSELTNHVSNLDLQALIDNLWANMNNSDDEKPLHKYIRISKKWILKNTNPQPNSVIECAPSFRSWLCEKDDPNYHILLLQTAARNSGCEGRTYWNWELSSLKARRCRDKATSFTDLLFPWLHKWIIILTVIFCPEIYRIFLQFLTSSDHFPKWK